MRTIQPGQRLVYRFRADRAGAWLYHCSAAPMLQHMGNGMYGAVVIDPPGLKKVDHEYVLVSSELYLGTPGNTAQVDAWFPPERRGLAIGIFGAGMGGTAISALTTVKLVKAHSMSTPFLITVVVLGVYALIAAVLLRDAPGRTVPTEPLARRLGATLQLGITWQASVLYAVAFGGYVAFSVYLPTYLKTGYGLTQADAANRMAGFVLLAVAMRPVGGWLSDRLGPVRVLAAALSVVVAGAVVQSFTPDLAPVGTIAFLAMAAALGAGSGATFALVALRTPAGKVGSVTGVVGAAGGLGGFLPPLAMGSLYGEYGTYAAGLALLAVVAAAALVYTLTGVRAATEGSERNIVYRSRDTQLGARPPRCGWERVG
ncbi:MFS transporter [Streptomyces sp. NPDC007856]|uniref:MFS transporter n=1 Tax=Streptomyces sp. NPDC007856 TaxID=3364781 RepID=UPI00367A1AE3